MAFDPTLPLDNSLIAAAELRAQFTGLREEFTDLITQIPAGPQGPQGDQGPPGPAFSSVIVDATIELPSGAQPSVTTSFDGVNVHFTFSIPQGAQGSKGDTGEVSNVQLTDAIATTAQNPTPVGAFEGAFSDPPTQAEMQAFAAYVESLRQALTRPT